MAEQERMDLQAVLRAILEESGLTYELTGEKLGFTKQNVWLAFNSKHSMPVKKLLKILDVFDCELIIRSKKKGHSEWVVVDDGIGSPPKIKGRTKNQSGGDL